MRYAGVVNAGFNHVSSCVSQTSNIKNQVSVLAAQDEDGAEAGWREPCSECGRCYYHEHIRAVQESSDHEEDSS